MQSDTQQREGAELLFNSSQHEAAINGAFAQEAARRAAVIKNMERLRALRLARDRVQTPQERP
jgi:hypothetical protein